MQGMFLNGEQGLLLGCPVKILGFGVLSLANIEVKTHRHVWVDPMSKPPSAYHPSPAIHQKGSTSWALLFIDRSSYILSFLLLSLLRPYI